MTTMMSRTAFFSALITTIMMEGPSSVVRSTTSSLRDNDNDELSPFASRDLEAHHQSSEEEGSEERQRRRRGSPRNNSTNVASSQQIFYETHDGAFDDAVLHRAIADAGQWAYGIVMVEVWVLNRTQTSLSRAEKGWWIHPSFVAKYDEASSSNSSDGGRGDLLRRITDPSWADYIAPTPVAPGEGLPGALWSEARHHYNTVGAGRRRRRPSTWGRDSQHHASMVSSSSRRWSAIRASVTMAAATTSFSSGGANIPDSATVGLEAEAGEVPHEVVFRDLTQISTDPDQPYHPRLQALVELGLGYVAAVPIHQGLVLFLARKNVPLSRLQSLPNLQYLAAASRLIEASYHLRQPRIAAERARREEVQHAWRRLRTKVLALKRLGIDLAEEVRKHEVSTQPQLPGAADSAPEAEAKGSRWWTAPGRHQQGFDWTQERVRRTVRKARGGGGTPPPSAHWHQSIFIFVGVFVTLAAVTNYSVLLSRLSGSNRAVVPLGCVPSSLVAVGEAMEHPRTPRSY